ncbi:DarT ssDNA thymidine ADP-ribosyltransferase family protein [Actinomadura xylanilytica]|uniref:DarT ssDNA thymidine ADP-ribosyltransferase family protein n=1 Tax=Actinomadura xylanilytica TaxID=887459 RepID=UPI00255B16C0|nr:DarT ssDNA thymidine ADP-ribosyltransferase family protein [Actinomadura xylanilytica]MDL4774543.1 DarT ssDNA thymidine ADP-ribosyltransferase family protein [Actinomadura xylanilytica]
MTTPQVREARPRTAEELARLPPCPEVLDLARSYGVTDLVHFTTSRGVVGILARRAVLSRAGLTEDDYLEHVYRPNANVRKDCDWLGYVNLSVSRINDWMFGSSVRWHVTERASWVVLSFGAEVVAHPGVIFTTTNNMYPSALRAEGVSGFERMFAEEVLGRYSESVVRGADLEPRFPTHRQAEVLYPGALALDHLRRIDVQTEACLDDVQGMLGALDLDLEVRLDPEVFT